MDPGQQVTPTLRLVRLLAEGGMGSVWVADHLGLGVEVAVKFLVPAMAGDSSLVQRFRREATAAARIRSPHIVQVLDHGTTDDGAPYIAMELLEGEDLRSRLRSAGPLPPEETALIVGQVARALGRAHAIGIVHRDIKPANIFLTSNDGALFVKVLDFGIAKQAQATDLGTTATASLFGTPHYMSPEQLFSAKHVDHRSDLWSLGVVAYQALTGHLPFAGETLAAISVAIHTGTFAPPSSLRDGISPAVDAWFLRALRHDPAARFASASEMATALDTALRAPLAGSAGEQRAPPMPDVAELLSARPEDGPERAQLTPPFAGDARPGADGSPGPLTLGAITPDTRPPGASGTARRRSIALVAGVGLGLSFVTAAALIISRQNPGTTAERRASVGSAMSSPPAEESSPPTPPDMPPSSPPSSLPPTTPLPEPDPSAAASASAVAHDDRSAAGRSRPRPRSTVYEEESDEERGARATPQVASPPDAGASPAIPQPAAATPAPAGPSAAQPAASRPPTPAIPDF